MPITYLYYIGVIIIMTLLVVNVVVPLFNPKYKFFWLLRKDKYFEVMDEFNEAKKRSDMEELAERARQIKKERKK